MKLISYEEVRRKLGGEDGPSCRTIERMVASGEFVQPIQVAPRRVMFVESEVDAWIEARRKQKPGKRDPMDYARADVDQYIARINGYTLDQLMSLNFPAPDYTDAAGAGYWAFETVYAWLGCLHTAMLTMERAAAPEDFERFLQMLRDLMNQKGT